MKIILIITTMLLSSLAFAKISVVTTLPDYEVITKAIGGDKVTVFSIVQTGEDAHHVRPKPSFVTKVKDADLFITTGLDLELWVPSLLNRAGNAKVRSGQPGFVSAADGIPLIGKPKNLSHSEGGLHVYGNPHITTSPINMIYIAKNIAIGLAKVDSDNKSFYEEQYKNFKKEIIKKLFGEEIPKILGDDLTIKMAENGTLIDFLRKKEVGGEKLINKLGGWFKAGLPLYGSKIVTYHKSWGYLQKLLNLELVETIEVKPGVPPTPKHVFNVIKKIKENKIQFIIGANYFPEYKMKNVAEKTKVKLIVLSLNANKEDKDPMTKFNSWLEKIKGEK
jgi:ABC-type Zn uptake system ZnuABC Zn-binding protein ZnuA